MFPHHTTTVINNITTQVNRQASASSANAQVIKIRQRKQREMLATLVMSCIALPGTF